MIKTIKIEYPVNFSGVLGNQIEQATSEAISSTLMATKSKWEEIAQSRLKSTLTDFMLGLNADDSMEFIGNDTGVLTLRGKWPNMIEEGFPAYDMKEGMLNGPRSKVGADGKRYNTVPFRHQTPGTVQAVGGAAMPTDIYSQARVLANQERLSGTETAYPASTSWTGYQHKSGIYEGMTRNRKTYDKATQSSYFTFRRVSEASDPASWWHPGYEGLKAIGEVESFARDTFGKVLTMNLDRLMG